MLFKVKRSWGSGGLGFWGFVVLGFCGSRIFGP